MKLIAPILRSQDIEVLAHAGVSEVLLCWSALARRFHFSHQEEVLQAIKHCQRFNLTPVLLWDQLMSEEQKEKCWQSFLQLISPLTIKEKENLKVRILDPGIGLGLESRGLPIKVQFIAHNGGHNFAALEGWAQLLAPVLDRVILSPELPIETILDYQKRASFPLEVTLLSPLLLFYTPRSLLANQNPGGETIYRADSEETHHRGFEVRASSHATLMYHHKDFSILDEYHKLLAAGLAAGLIDWTRTKVDFLLAVDSFFKESSDHLQLKELYPRPLFRGYALNNRSDVLFSKLKNSRLQARHHNYCGEVLHMESGQSLGVMIKRGQLRPGDELEFVNPEGKKKALQLTWIKDLDGQNLNLAEANQLVMLPFVPRMTVKSQVFFKSSDKHES